MKKISKGLLALALTGLLQLLWTQCGAAEVVDRIVAEVNDEIITMSELQQASKSLEAQAGINPKGKEGKAFEKQTLEALIDRRLARAEAQRRGVHIEDKELAAALADFKKRNHLESDEVFSKALNKAGLTLKEFKLSISDQMIQERLVPMVVGSKTVVTDAEVRRIYEENYKEGSGGTRLHLRSVQMPFPPGATEAQKEEMKKTAEAIIGEVKNGGSFSEVVKKHALSVNDVGFISQNDLDPRLSEFLGKLKPKEIAPALTPQGVQLIQLVERRSGGGERKSFEEAAPEIRRILTQEEMKKKFSEWVKTLRANAHIKIML